MHDDNYIKSSIELYEHTNQMQKRLSYVNTRWRQIFLNMVISQIIFIFK